MPAFEATFEAIDKSVQQVFVRWKIYGQLFDSGEENVEILNSSGSYVFFLLQRLLLDDMILALSRLSDPPATAGRENASIRYLVQVAPTLSPKVAPEVNVSLVEFETHVANVRIHRNKAVAHADLQHAVGKAPLPDISYSELEGAMNALTNLMLRLGSPAIHRVGGYEPIIAFGTDGNTLLAKLRKASAAEAERPGR